MLRSNLCDYSDWYIVVKGRIKVTGTNNANIRNKKLISKNNVQFRSCILKINNTLIDNAEAIDIAMPMYNLLEYSDNYSMTAKSLWNYYRDEVTDDANENNDANNYRINNNKKTTGKSFEYNINIIWSTPDNNSRLDAEFVIALKYLSTF